MTKPALFYTLRRKWHVGGFEVVRVTTVKRHRQTGSPTHYYGTDDTGGNTHCRADQCVGGCASSTPRTSPFCRRRW